MFYLEDGHVTMIGGLVLYRLQNFSLSERQIPNWGIAGVLFQCYTPVTKSYYVVRVTV